MGESIMEKLPFTGTRGCAGGVIRIGPVVCLKCVHCHSDTQGIGPAERNTWFAERPLVDIWSADSRSRRGPATSSDDPPMHPDRGASHIPEPITAPDPDQFASPGATRDPGHRQMRLGAVKPHLNQTPCSPAKFAQVFRTGGLACGAIQDAYNGFHRGRHLARRGVRSMMCVTRQDVATSVSWRVWAGSWVAFRDPQRRRSLLAWHHEPVCVPLSGSRGVSGPYGR